MNPFHASSGPHKAPFFRPDERGVDEALGEVELASISKVLGQSLQDLVEDPGTVPLLESAVAGSVGGIAVRNVFPGSAGAKNPEDPVEHFPGMAPGTTAPIGAHVRLRD